MANLNSEIDELMKFKAKKEEEDDTNQYKTFATTDIVDGKIQ